MAHFAKILNNRVVQVIVAEQDFVDSIPGTWVQTSYNTRGGKHFNPETGEEDNGTPLRKNYAGVGYTYDSSKDAFIPPQPFNSWILNEDTCLWEAPVLMPDDGENYKWNEDTTSWELE